MKEKDQNKKHVLKKHYIFCFTAIPVIMVGFFIFLCTYSSNCTIAIFLNGRTDLNSVRLELSEDNIVKVEDIRENNFNGVINTIELDLRSVSHGDVKAKVYYDDISDSDDAAVNNGLIVDHSVDEIELHVFPFGMIYCTTYDYFNGMWVIRLFWDLLMVVLIITFCISFREKLKSGSFTYSMVTFGGLIFFMSVTVILSVINILYDIDYQLVLNVRNLIYSLSTVITTFIYGTIIPLFIFCLLLAVSNIQLVIHEGFRVQNMLGFLLGISVIAGIVLMNLFGSDLYLHSETEQIFMIIINTAISFTFCYMECLLVSTIFCALMSTRYKIKKPMDYIIILGCAIRGDGTPTPILRGRIDRAIAFDKEQYEKWGRNAKFVPSGGQGSNEVVSEAECMKRYLMEQGIPEERILKEDKSVNTYQNMAFSNKVIKSDSEDIENAGIAFSTTNYHVFRGYTLADRLGMRVKGLSAKTKLYFFPNAFLREFIGLIVEQGLLHLFVIIPGILIFTTLYILVYF